MKNNSMDNILFLGLASFCIASFVLYPTTNENRDNFNLVLDELLQENIHGVPSQVVRSIKRRNIDEHMKRKQQNN